MDEEDETRPLLGNASLKGLGDIEVAKALQNYIPGTPEEKKLLRKIDLRLMPILWVMYILNYVDRTNIGNAKIAGMSEDLHLDDSRYAVCLSIFFIGYLVMEVPSNMLLSRSRPSIFLPGIMLVWGAFSAVSLISPKNFSLVWSCFWHLQPE
jgi:sugar phosphate permease